MLPETFRCYLVTKTDRSRIEGSVERRPTFELPAGEVLIEVVYSSLNFKDALAATGHPGIARRFPHVPGIDAAGTVIESRSPEIHPGDQVLVTSYELGVERWGGWAELLRVPADWIVPLPAGLTLEESMVLGTAGLTAGLCLKAFERHGVQSDSGPVLVTGASGGVGSLAVMLLSRLGYRVTAVSGKRQRHDWLRELGARDVVAREAILDDSPKPLLTARWAGAVDTVGGTMLASLLKSIDHQGCVAACGLVGGPELTTTVYPFILRGVSLDGIDSGWCSMERRREVWAKLAGPWKPPQLASIRQVIGMGQIQDGVQRMLSGDSTGRTLIDVKR